MSEGGCSVYCESLLPMERKKNEGSGNREEGNRADSRTK